MLREKFHREVLKDIGSIPESKLGELPYYLLSVEPFRGKCDVEALEICVAGCGKPRRGREICDDMACKLHCGRCQVVQTFLLMVIFPWKSFVLGL